MAVASNQVAGFEAWQIQSLRLTILLNPAPVQAEQNWWERIIGTPPDQVASQPRQALHSEQGSFHNHSLNLRLQPGKIDWTLTAPMTAEVFENIPAIGSFEAAVDIFRPVAHEWLNICPSFHRLALGMNLPVSVQRAKEFITQAIHHGDFVSGHLVLNSFWSRRVRRP